MDGIIKRVESFICLNNLIDKDDVVGCALSGGADSIFMTYVLKKLSLHMGFKIIAIHVNHMLRGEDSYLDESFSKRFCEENDIEFISFRYDVLELSKKSKISVEMAGREVRYDIFSKLKEDNVITKCALAHHADDDVETIIMRIFNGTGIDGIEGIKVKRDDFYVRPILFLRRVHDIESYLNDNGISFITDKSNLSEDYLRNKIRLSIIPSINNSFSKDVTKSVLSLKEICKYDNEFFNDLIKEYMDKYVKITSSSVVINKKAFKLHKSILYRLIRECIFIFNGKIDNITLKHIKSIDDLSNKSLFKVLQIKKSLFCLNNESNIEILREDISKFKHDDVLLELVNKNDILNLKEGVVPSIVKAVNFLGKNIKVHLSIENNHSSLKLNSRYEKYFSIQGIENGIYLRNRRFGDRFRPFGMKSYKKLKDFFINQKVKNRESIPLICFDDTIVWIFGIRNSEDFKVLPSDLQVIKIKMDF